MANTLDTLTNQPRETEDMLFGIDHHRPTQGVTISTTRLADGTFKLLAEWASRGPGVPGCVTEPPFRLQRTFTTARYAAEWIDSHIVAVTFTAR